MKNLWPTFFGLVATLPSAEDLKKTIFSRKERIYCTLNCPKRLNDNIKKEI